MSGEKTHINIETHSKWQSTECYAQLREFTYETVFIFVVLTRSGVNEPLCFAALMEQYGGKLTNGWRFFSGIYWKNPFDTHTPRAGCNNSFVSCSNRHKIASLVTDRRASHTKGFMQQFNLNSDINPHGKDEKRQLLAWIDGIFIDFSASVPLRLVRIALVSLKDSQR